MDIEFQKPEEIKAFQEKLLQEHWVTMEKLIVSFVITILLLKDRIFIEIPRQPEVIGL